MKLPAASQSYFETKVIPNIPPSALSLFSKRINGVATWKNDKVKIVHYDGSNDTLLRLTTVDTETNQFNFYLIDRNPFLTSDTIKRTNTINLID